MKPRSRVFLKVYFSENQRVIQTGCPQTPGQRSTPRQIHRQTSPVKHQNKVRNRAPNQTKPNMITFKRGTVEERIPPSTTRSTYSLKKLIS